MESEFAEYYCKNNWYLSIPIRKMAGTMLLRNIYNMSDEGVVAHWLENPYFPMDAKSYRKVIGRMRISIPASGPPEQNLAGDWSFEIRLLDDAELSERCPGRRHQYNTMMAVAACDISHWMNNNPLSSFVSWLKTLVGRLESVILGYENQTACLFLALAEAM